MHARDEVAKKKKKKIAPDKDRARLSCVIPYGKTSADPKAQQSETHRTPVPLASLDSIREPENFCRVQGLECQACASGSIEIRCKGRAKVENDFKHVITRLFGENYRRVKRREAVSGKRDTEGEREEEERERNEDRFTKSSLANSYHEVLSLCAAKSADPSR